jgi:hypothetical protein
MSGPITREEFAELATRLYEVYTGKKAEAAPVSTFTDTSNPEILKANKFAPKTQCTREQAVLIAVRVYEAYK